MGRRAVAHAGKGPTPTLKNGAPTPSLVAKRQTSIVLYEFSACHESGKIRRLLRQYDLGYEARTLVQGDKSVVRQQFGTDTVPIVWDGDFVSADPVEICKQIEKRYAPQG